MEWARFDVRSRMAFDGGDQNGRAFSTVLRVLFEEGRPACPQGTQKREGGRTRSHRLVERGVASAVVGANYHRPRDGIWMSPQKPRECHFISMWGPDGFHGEYCFRLGNGGDVGGDPSSSWFNGSRRNGKPQRSRVICPTHDRGGSISASFRQECEVGVSIRRQSRRERRHHDSGNLGAHVRQGCLRMANGECPGPALGYGGLVVFRRRS